MNNVLSFFVGKYSFIFGLFPNTEVENIALYLLVLIMCAASTKVVSSHTVPMIPAAAAELIINLFLGRLPILH